MKIQNRFKNFVDLPEAWNVEMREQEGESSGALAAQRINGMEQSSWG